MPFSPPATVRHQNPVVAAYCASFLKPEMLHIFRQIIGVRRYRSIVIARKRENADRFPFEPVIVIPKPWHHEFRRFWARSVMHRTMTISRAEARAILVAMERMCADVAHIYFGNIGVQLLPFLQVSTLPTIVSFHGADVRVDLDRPASRALMVEALERATLILARSESLKARVMEFGCPASKIRIHRTGIPLGEIAFKPRTSPPDGRWRIFQACRLIEKKGLPTTLTAFALFVQRHPQARLIIAGEGPMLEHLRDLAVNIGIARCVDFAGFLDQGALREQLYRSHIFVHPSEVGKDGNQEGVPNGMLEAMASGLPVVSTRHGGIPEAITDGVNGILCAEGDVPAVAQGLLDLAADAALRTALAEAGAASVREKFDSARQVEVLEACYDEAIQLFQATNANPIAPVAPVS